MSDEDLGERVRRFTGPGVDRISRLISAAEDFYKQAGGYAGPLLNEFSEGIPEFRRQNERYFFYALTRGIQAVFLIGKAIYRQNEARLKKDGEIIGLLAEQKVQFDAFITYLRSKQDDGK